MATLLTGTGVQAMSQTGSIFAIGGAITGAIGSYYAAQSQKAQLESQASSMRFQSDISQLNAAQAEFTAQQIMRVGQQRQGKIGLRAGKIKSSQRASMAARGIDLGVGSAVETIATTDLMKEIDMLTTNAETVRSAEAARLQRQNYLTASAMQDVSAMNLAGSAASISPMMALGGSLLGSAGSVANAWYQDRKLAAIASRLGIE
jgi:NAD dependent epimerase/dehydratase family enzyme